MRISMNHYHEFLVTLTNPVRIPRMVISDTTKKLVERAVNITPFWVISPVEAPWLSTVV